MYSTSFKIKLSGVFILLGILAGLFSIAPAVDSTDFLWEAAAHAKQTKIAAVYQIIMSLTYLGFAILFFPVIKNIAPRLALGFLSLRLIAVILSLLGTILLISVLVLSQRSAPSASANTEILQIIGIVLKDSRDLVNHVFMVLALTLGNIFFYSLLLKAKLIPLWLSGWGLMGNLLSAVASLLILFQMMEVISSEYLILNAPTALQEVIFAFWLIIKGLRKPYKKISDNRDGNVVGEPPNMTAK